MTKKIVGGFPRRNKSLTCPEFQTTPSGLRCDCCEITGVDAKMKGSHYPSSHHHHQRVHHGFYSAYHNSTVMKEKKTFKS